MHPAISPRLFDCHYQKDDLIEIEEIIILPRPASREDSKMSNEAKKITKWLLEKKIILPIIILLLLASLFMAICYRIDGLGIFSIIGCVLILLAIMYHVKPNLPDADGGSGFDIEKNIERNFTYFLNLITNPNHLPLLLKFFGRIVNKLEASVDKLNSDQIEYVNKRISQLNKKIKNRNMPSPEPPLTRKNRA